MASLYGLFIQKLKLYFRFMRDKTGFYPNFTKNKLFFLGNFISVKCFLYLCRKFEAYGR